MNNVQQNTNTAAVDRPPTPAVALLPPLEPDKLPNAMSHEISSTKQPSFSRTHSMYSTNSSLYRHSCPETSSTQQGATMPPLHAVVALLLLLLLEASSTHSLMLALLVDVTARQLEQVSSSRQANSSVGQDSVLSVLSSVAIEAKLAPSTPRMLWVVIDVVTRSRRRRKRGGSRGADKARRKPKAILVVVFFRFAGVLTALR